MCTICSTLMRLTGDINAMKSALYELQAEKGEESSSVRIGTAVAFLRPCPSCLQHRAGEILVNLPNLTEVDSNHQEEEAENSEDEDPSPHLLDPFSAALEAWEEGDRPPVTVSMATVLKRKKRKKPKEAGRFQTRTQSHAVEVPRPRKLSNPGSTTCQPRSRVRPRPPSGLIRGCATARHCGP